MIGIFIQIAALITIIWSFFEPSLASKIFLFVFIVGFEGYIFLMWLAGKPRHLRPFTEPLFLAPDEVSVVKKYHLYFKFPFASRQFSGAISFVQILSFVWVPWLLYKGYWLTGVIIGINYFIAGSLAMQLNPRLFLQRATGAATLIAINELQAIDSAKEKLFK